MPNFYIVEQIRRNTNKVIQCLGQTISKIWAGIDKYSTKFANGFNKEIVGRITRKAHKHRKCLKIFLLILAVLALMTGLFMGSFKSAGAREQGFQVNYTEQVFKLQYLTNDWKYTGLNGYIETVPKQKILIQFSRANLIPQQQQQTNQVYQAIQARVVQGTKLIIEASLQCSIVILDDKNTNMKLFFDMYGFKQTPNRQSQLQWMTYLRQKITNLIVQTISKESFYSISNSNLKQSINAQLNSLYEANKISFPFKISLLTLTVNFPQNSFSTNNTLGIQLLRAKSIVNQLNNQYQTTQTYVTNNYGLINQTYAQNAQLSAEIDSRLLNIYSYEGWMKGLDLVKKITEPSTWPNPSNSLNREKFLWLYFNNLYNATYRNEKVQSVANSSSNFQANAYLKQQLPLY